MLVNVGGTIGSPYLGRAGAERGSLITDDGWDSPDLPGRLAAGSAAVSVAGGTGGWVDGFDSPDVTEGSADGEPDID